VRCQPAEGLRPGFFSVALGLGGCQQVVEPQKFPVPGGNHWEARELSHIPMCK
jgi:hypothetical protein